MQIEMRDVNGELVNKIEVKEGQILVLQYSERVTIQQMNAVHSMVSQAFDHSASGAIGTLHLPYYATLQVVTLKKEGEANA